jgi:tRNA threonylcarbamoyladenosine biosynthesis protein TsaB
MKPPNLATILNIDTATETASVCLSTGDVVGAIMQSEVQKEHAAFIHEAIRQTIEKSGLSLSDIDAVAITIGPGSYTGLRVGLATAKGLCYVLNKPLIVVNTLEVMATALVEIAEDKTALFCPMIDARRMDVFTGIYSNRLEKFMAPRAITLMPNTFDEWLNNGKVYFSGNGSTKFAGICQHENALFLTSQHSAAHVAKLAFEAYKKMNFADLAYVEPLYLKEFYTTATGKVL